MPKAPDWRSQPAADDLDKLERPELAAEFLRRNRDYRRDYDRTARRLAAGKVSEADADAALARRWGLSFRLCAL
jgi:hypothetical protein